MFKSALMMAAVPAALIAATPASALVFLGSSASSTSLAATPEPVTIYRTNWVSSSWDKRPLVPSLTSPEFAKYGRGGAQPSLVSAAALPEPMTWAMMVIGMGVIGWSLRAGRRDPAFS